MSGDRVTALVGVRESTVRRLLSQLLLIGLEGESERGKREGKKRGGEGEENIKEETGRKGKIACVLGEERRLRREAADKAT